MKKLIIAIILDILIISSSYANDVVQVNVTGSIEASTCNITMKNQTINLGLWPSQSTSGIGTGVNSTSSPVEYALNFDCPPGITIDAQLEGNQYDPSDIFYIGLDKTSDSAEGVIIVMHYFKDKWNSLVYGDTRTLFTSTIDGINSIRLRSYYKQVAASIKPGVANSTVTVTITYTSQ